MLREGLRLVEQREAEDAYRLEALRSATQIGLSDIEAGRFKKFDTSELLRAHLELIASKAISAA